MPIPDSLDFVLDLLFPINCFECRVEGVYLCSVCQEKISAPLPHCFVCGKPSLLGQTHKTCLNSSQALDGLIVIADYQKQSVKDLVWNLKYNSVADIAEILALLMVDFFVKNELTEYFAAALVTAVPLHKKRQRIRGFNQAQLLAEKFASRLALEYRPLLERLKNTRRQVDLERAERFENVKQIFSAIGKPSLGDPPDTLRQPDKMSFLAGESKRAGRKIILVDDVATTGATLNECAKVLKAQEAAEVWGLVVARN